MTCFCSAKAAPLMASLRLIPPTIDLIPPISLELGVALGAALGLNPLALSANVAVQETAAANLASMAMLSSALQAALGLKLSAAVQGPALPAVQAQLAAAVNSFNAGSGPLLPNLGLLASLTLDLSDLARLAGLLLAIKATLGIDLRAPGALLALQARLSANATASLALSAPLSLIPALLAALNLKADVQGAASAGVLAAGTASLLAGLPAIGNFNLLALLAALLPMLDAIQLAFGVNLRQPNSLAALRASLAMFPLAGLAQLAVSANASVSANAALAAGLAANLPLPLNLTAVAAAQLTGIAPLSMLMSAMAVAGLGLPPGECGQPCPIALLSKGPPPPSLSTDFSVR